MLKNLQGNPFVILVFGNKNKVIRKFLTIAKNQDEAFDNFWKVEKEEREAGEPLAPMPFVVEVQPVEFEREIFDL